MKVLIVYGSSMGNTKRVAHIINGELIGCEANIVDVVNVKDSDYLDVDIVIFGSSTWNYGDLQTHFRRYIDHISVELIGGKKVAVFGCGDKFGFTSVFCKGVDTIAEKVITCGGNIITESLKVDRKVEDNMENIVSFARRIK